MITGSGALPRLASRALLPRDVRIPLSEPASHVRRCHSAAGAVLHQHRRPGGDSADDRAGVLVVYDTPVMARKVGADGVQADVFQVAVR